MDRAKIEAQAPHFFEWPAGSPKNTVTLTSCILFAQTIAQMATDAERERCAKVCIAEALRLKPENDGYKNDEYDDGAHAAALDCAAEIRRPANLI